MVKIVEVKTNKQIRDFINFPLKLYKDNPYYVPELYNDVYQLIKYNKTYKDVSKNIYLLAYKDNKIVGRIQGIIQEQANKKWNQKRVRFTRFDSIDDLEVSNTLFKYVEEWAKGYKMEEIVGPLGYSDLDREGLLIEGFDKLSTFEETYSYEYYPKLVEAYGFSKEVDYEEREIRNKPIELRDNRYKEYTDKLINKYGYHYASSKNTNDFIKKYGDFLFKVLDETYEHIYGTVPLNDKMKKMIIDNFKLICNIKYVTVVFDKDENPAAFSVSFPSISKSIQACQGKLFPFGFIKVLHEIKHPTVIDLGLVGVLPRYRLRGVSCMIFNGLIDMLDNPSIDHAETNLNLENNKEILSVWNSFDNVLHKKRRVYKKTIN